MSRGEPVRGPPGLLVLALGRRRRRHLGPDQPARAAVDPPRRDPRGDLRPLWATTDAGSVGLDVAVSSVLPRDHAQLTGVVRGLDRATGKTIPRGA